MLINLLSLITGIVGFITTTIVLVRYKSNPLINKHLILLLSVISTRYLLRGFSFNLNEIPTEIFICANVFVLILMTACTYLYFRDLLYSRKWHRKDAIHLIVPAIIVALFAFNVQFHFSHDRTIRIIYVTLLIFCYLIYNFFSYRLLRQNIWSKKSSPQFPDKQSNTIKSWTLYLYIAIVVLGLMIIIVFITNDFNYNYVGNKYQVTFASLFWLGFFIKLLATPELLYGYDFMKIKIEAYKKAEMVLDTVWLLHMTSVITNQKDLKIASSMTTNLPNYIHQIESISFHTQTFRNPTLTVEAFAKKLDLPTVHLLYVFKYHCSLSFVEYKKMVRIHDAIKLLESGFLKSKTMESLAIEVGFSSYKPFYTSFKSITGRTPQEYSKTL
jgi:AraC-like DNA-binding protein